MSSFVSDSEYRKRTTGTSVRTVQVVTLVLLVLFGLGPLYWMLKGALSSPAELAANPLALWPSEPRWENFWIAIDQLGVGQYLLNTVWIVAGSWAVQLFVAITAGYALSIIRPRFGNWVYGAILATMFVPYTVSMASLFLTIVDFPIGHVSLANTYWAIWLPAGASAFNVLLAKSFFDGLPRELFEAARVDGAGTWTILWRIAMPMSRPILAVISLLAISHSWKDFIWPFIVIKDTALQPISVALVNLGAQASQDLLIATMVMAVIPPIAVFIVFQKQIVAGLGFTGLKG
jgi:ABC-type glycerol-3-phosphate transport system permease component